MSVRMKLTHAKTGSRRAHHRVAGATVVRTASGVRRMHFVDPVTGMYRGKQILSKSASSKEHTHAVEGTAKKASPKKKDEDSK